VLELQNRELQDVLAEKFQPDNLVVQSGAMQKTMAMVQAGGGYGCRRAPARRVGNR
jgi:hypothetical protein